MRYPALLACGAALSRLDEFDAIIDVRSPAEYEEDHIPGAINCPVLSGPERAQVGTMYKQVSAFEARKLGAALVARNIAHHLETTFADKPHEWKPLIYCWRGGNRSGAMAHIMARVGWPALQLDGGYREYRRHVIQELELLSARFSFRVICGTTGSGKSRLLQTLAAAEAQVLDLERLAAHRGSVLGHLPDAPQPGQKAFESRIWHALRGFDPGRPVYVESESKKVGDLRVPETLMAQVRAASCLALRLPMERRVALLMEDYPHFMAEPETLSSPLECLLQLHGREQVARWKSMAGSGAMADLVRELLERHYDPAYQRSIARNFKRIGQARDIVLPDYSQAAMAQAAQEILEHEQE